MSRVQCSAADIITAEAFLRRTGELWGSEIDVSEVVNNVCRVVSLVARIYTYKIDTDFTIAGLCEHISKSEEVSITQLQVAVQVLAVLNLRTPEDVLKSIIIDMQDEDLKGQISAEWMREVNLYIPPNERWGDAFDRWQDVELAVSYVLEVLSSKAASVPDMHGFVERKDVNIDSLFAFFHSLWTIVRQKLWVEEWVYADQISRIIDTAISNLCTSVLPFLHDLSETSEIDDLTGLHNRRYYEKELARQVWEMFRVEKSFTIVFLDLDGFKDVNDTYGHGVGDEVLKWIAQKLKEYFPRSTDTITRWGGDEFAMILGMVDMSQIPVIAYKLEEFLREISDIIDISQIAHDYEGIVSIWASIGMHTVSHEDLLDESWKRETNDKVIAKINDRVDAQMYQVKEDGKWRVSHTGYEADVLSKAVKVIRDR